jgi:Family of unknown function (DUF6790)
MINLNSILILITLFGATLHCIVKRKQLDKKQAIDIFLIYFLVICVGVVASIGFISHVFFADQTAKMIGWPPGSPFQFEVGFHDGAWGLLGFLCLRWRDKFWLATGIGWSFFMLGAALGHVKQTFAHGDFAIYNVGMIFPDLFIPIVILVLLWMKFRQA